MIGKAIRAEREKQGISQSELARRAGLTPSHINLIESGRRANPQSDVLMAIARALNVTLDNLLYGGPLPEAVAQLAAEGVRDDMVAEVNRMWPGLSDEDRATVLNITRALWERTKVSDPKQARNTNGHPRTAT